MLTLLILLSFATYRVTRFLIADTLIVHQRIWVLNTLQGRKPGKVRNKIAELLTCKFCLSVWIAAALVVATDQFAVIQLPWLMWPAVCAGSLVTDKFAEASSVEVVVDGVVNHREKKYGA